MDLLQNAEFRLLKQFVEICDELGLKYYLVCGSALGAVKYGGFIPWDDDIDVAMPRKDYEIFLQKAPERLPKSLFLQNFRSEPKFPQIYSKLRDSDTTYIENSAADLPINHGIFIDIFPLDGYPSGKFARKRLEFFKKLYTGMMYTAYDLPRSGKGKVLCSLFRAFGVHRRTARIAARLDRLIRKYPPVSGGILCNHGNWQGSLDYAPFDWFGEGAKAEFEGLKVRIPAQYDAYLTRKYGDWRADLPEEEQVGHHYYKVCDCERPYTDYAK